VRAGRPPGAWAVGRPTLHGGPVRLRPVRATPCLQHTTKCHILLLRNSKLFTLVLWTFVRRFSSRRPAALKTCSLADAGKQRILRASQNILGSTECLSRQNPLCPHLCWPSYWRSQKVLCAVSRRRHNHTSLWSHRRRVDVTTFYWMHSHRVDCWEFWHTWKSSHSHSHYCHVYSSHPIPIYGTFVFPSPWNSNGNGIPFPMYISRCYSPISSWPSVAIRQYRIAKAWKALLMQLDWLSIEVPVRITLTFLC